MPIFIDRHQITQVPAAVRFQIQLEAQHGEVDPSGTRPLSHWIADQVIYCIMGAPSEEAVRQHHAARGIRVTEIYNLHQEQAWTDAIRAAIVALWPADFAHARDA